MGDVDITKNQKHIILRKKNLKYIIFLIIIIVLLYVHYLFKYNLNSNVNYNNKEWLVTSGDHYNYKNRIGKLTINSAKIDYNMSGVETFWKFIVEEKTNIYFQCKNTLLNGKAKLILVSPTNEIEIMFEGNIDDDYVINLDKGISRIRFVGEKAVGNLEITFEYGDNVKVEVMKN